MRRNDMFMVLIVLAIIQVIAGLFNQRVRT
jgi:hypothetical protein